MPLWFKSFVAALQNRYDTAMKRLALGVFVLTLVGAAVVLSQTGTGPGKTAFLSEPRNPVSHLRWNDDPSEFRFAIVSDRTGTHRANVFAQAVAKLNLLQPEFVITVGDLIEGDKQPPLEEQWKEFDGLLSKLEMPFFYVAGNHDVGKKETAKFWEDKLGRRHYHFVYRDVLFLLLNADDPPGSIGNISKEQIAYAEKTLNEIAKVRWTLVFVHRPLWTKNDGIKNGWAEVEHALMGRPYTVFCGHVHSYQKFVRQGMYYYQLATTGGGSRMRGVDVGEFDHITWVTMKKEGPVLANILIDAVQTEDLRPIKTNEPGKFIPIFPTHPVAGKVYFEGVPIPGAEVTLTRAKGIKGIASVAVVAADGSFQMSTYKPNDGVPVGEYKVTVVWREERADGIGANRLPAKYASVETTPLAVTVVAGDNRLTLELKK